MKALLQNLLSAPERVGLSDAAYCNQLNDQARKITAKQHLSLDDVRELLVLSSSSACQAADDFLLSQSASNVMIEQWLSVIADHDDYGSGDARIQAAYYLSISPVYVLRPYAAELVELCDAEDCSKPGGSLRPLLNKAIAHVAES